MDRLILVYTVPDVLSPRVGGAFLSLCPGVTDLYSCDSSCVCVTSVIIVSGSIN